MIAVATAIYSTRPLMDRGSDQATVSHQKYKSPAACLLGRYYSFYYQLPCRGSVYAIVSRLCLSSASTIAVPKISSLQQRSRFRDALTISATQQFIRYSVATSKTCPVPNMAPSEVVSNPCKPAYIHEVVAHPSPWQSFIQPTKDNKTHIVHFTTPFPNCVSHSQALTTRIELSHPHTDECAFCAALRGESPAPAVNNIFLLLYHVVVKVILLICFLTLCAYLLDWAWNINLAYLQTKFTFEGDFEAHTSFNKTQAIMSCMLFWPFFTC